MLPVGRDLDPGPLHKCGAALLFIFTIAASHASVAAVEPWRGCARPRSGRRTAPHR
ncbi:hypothetical protein C4K25_3343 [Pseudomonas chlororaphis]|nr:hypothetical protein C4K27_3564 [Pseudomonas chlororaphis subsp. chlororaphis]AZD16272.1 hypothetical protein C4K25_3343 [Pseudomonas chlororaphis]